MSGQTHHAEFRHARLVEVYDAECGWSRDDDFFMSIVSEQAGRRVLDLGCGTGRLTLGLAAAGHIVTGVDPAAASIERARTKRGADRVTWIHGASSDVATGAFDAAVMTSHVAQFFVGDDEWSAALLDLARAIVPGGVLVFDARDPLARAWERWNPDASRHEVALADGSSVLVWTDVASTDVDGAGGTIVSFTIHYAFDDGDQLQSTATLRFRSEAVVRSSLADAGFMVEAIYGGWQREPIGAGDGELLVVARR
ncbi:MAG: methyltransferase type 11 [Ilumatobacteraceae bacterium]|nr:methyltransferase type 11 [Ilumatobacteraceae bacterium]MCU1388568.1 methyltransferase type 11 [Ilumatobacteraceae bacterium]